MWVLSAVVQVRISSGDDGSGRLIGCSATAEIFSWQRRAQAPRGNRGVVMPKTKQTAGKSTGGLAPKKQLATKGARLSAERLHELQSDAYKSISAHVTRNEYILLDGSNKEHTVSGAELRALFPVQIYEHMRARKGGVLTKNDAFLWGLTHGEVKDGKPVGVQVPVERVALATSECTLLSGGRREARIEGGVPGRFYASSAGYGGTTDVGDTSALGWFEIYFYTLDVENMDTGKAVVYEVNEDTDTLSVAQEGTPADSLDAAFRWCCDYPGLILNLDIAGARGESGQAHEHHDTTRHVQFQSRHGLCLQLSLLNAVSLMQGSRVEGQSVLDRAFAHLRKAQTMGQLASFVQRFLPSLQLEHLRAPDGTARRGHTFDPKSVANLPSGVYLVRLLGVTREGKRVDHMVVVDTRRREDQLIWDSFESFPMTLSLAALDCCVGDGAALRDVKEVRCLAKVPGRKRPMTPRRRNRKKARRRQMKDKHAEPGVAKGGESADEDHP